MIIYKDILSNDEMISDSFKVEMEGVMLKANCKMVPVGSGHVDIGANPSAEQEEEQYDTSLGMVNNIVYAFRLQEMDFDKGGWTAYIKSYMKQLKEKIAERSPDKIEEFQRNAQEFVKHVLGNFDDYTFYTGESLHPDGMCALLKYAENGMDSTLYFFKDGLYEDKV